MSKVKNSTWVSADLRPSADYATTVSRCATFASRDTLIAADDHYFA
jgi:hypothetical protein